MHELKLKLNTYLPLTLIVFVINVIEMVHCQYINLPICQFGERSIESQPAVAPPRCRFRSTAPRPR